MCDVFDRSGSQGGCRPVPPSACASTNPVPYDRPRAPGEGKRPSQPLSEEKRQDERILEVVKELSEYSEARLEGDWAADAAGESTPGSFDLVQMWRWARMFVTSKHMVGDMKLGDALNDGNIQWWESQLKTVDAPLAGRLKEAATPFAKVQIMFDDMEGWCFEQGKNGETMQTLFWGN